MKKKMKKKIFITLGSVPAIYIISLLVVVGFVFAFSLYTYFTPGKDNPFTFAYQQTLSISIEEPNVVDNQSVPWGNDTKKVSIKNVNENGEVEAVVRAMVVPVVYNEQDEVVPADLGDIMTAPSGNTWTLGDLTIYMADNWQENWIFQDGYFYYKQTLYPGTKTEDLIEGATLANSGNYNGQSFTIQVLADGLSVDDMAMWGLEDTSGSVAFI